MNHRTGPHKRLLKPLAIGCFLFLGGLLSFLLLVDLANPSDFWLFVGRFHPVVVHFPIAFLILAALLEALSFFTRSASLRPAIVLILGLGAASALLAAVEGYLLSLSGGYEESTIFWHMWLGFSVAGGAVLALALKLLRSWVSYPILYGAVLAITAGMLMPVGHLGATLTHGPGYLTRYLPDSIKSIVGLSVQGDAGRGKFADIQSAVVFEDLVQPILQERCLSCHNEAKKKGGLQLDAPEAIMQGGQSGKILVAGNPGLSEIVRRITLPLYHEDRMPPEEAQPLTVGETELIRWWVERGASFEHTVAEAGRQEVPPAVQTVLNRLSAPYEEKPAGVYALDIPPAEPGLLRKLQDAGVGVSPLSEESTLLQIDFPETGGELGVERMKALLPLAPQITWLDLSGQRLSEDACALLSGLKHLTRLHLERSSVTDAGLAHLASLGYLEYLNLYGTGVSDAGLRHLGKIESLRTVYLWQTRVSPQGVQVLKGDLSGVEVHLGAEIVPIQETAVAESSS
ncbi:MAG: c-type cytochrome domain-containing protein [Acidobacteriota bacterium]